jgi:hypothetical protein
MLNVPVEPARYRRRYWQVVTGSNAEMLKRALTASRITTSQTEKAAESVRFDGLLPLFRHYPIFFFLDTSNLTGLDFSLLFAVPMMLLKASDRALAELAIKCFLDGLKLTLHRESRNSSEIISLANLKGPL